MRRYLIIILTVFALAGSYSLWALEKPLPLLQPHGILATLPQSSEPALTWPTYGNAAVGATGYGLLATHGDQKPLPTASVAKVMTALAILQKKPLKLGEQGPTLTIGSADIDFYNEYVAQGGSVVPVNYGEEISEYQALQALLLPSANNMAKTLATWAFGSEKAYTDYANTYAKQLGMKASNFADASGFSAATTSTASDLVLLGEKALQDPVLAQIVSLPTADIPVAGTVHNVNELLGQNGVNGIKTGNTEEAGGVYLASGTYKVASGHTITIVTALMGAPNLRTAMEDSLPLLASSQAGFVETTIIKQGQVVGYYNTPWHTSTNAIAPVDLKAFGWKSRLPKASLSMQVIRIPVREGQTVGLLKLPNTAPTAAMIQQNVPEPSWQWRLLHP